MSDGGDRQPSDDLGDVLGLSQEGVCRRSHDRMVPVADDLFDEHLRELESEGAPYAQDP